MGKRKIKLYIHHNVFQEYDTERHGSGFVVRILKTPSRIVFGLCYRTGLLLLAAHKAVRSIFQTFRYKRLPFSQPTFKFSAIVFLLCLIVTTVFLHAGSVVSSGLALQGRILGVTSGGLDQLKQAQQALENQETAVAQTQFAGALQQFQQSQQDIQNVGGILNGLLDLIPQKRDAEAVVAAISELTEAGLILTQSYEALHGVSVSAEGLSAADNKAALETFDQTLRTVIAKVDSASQKLDSVSESSVPQDKRLLFVQARDTVSIAQKALHNFQGVYGLFAEIISGNKQILLFFQNNNELRATGGFLGTYGNLAMTDGKINNMKISSIYDLDGQLTETITPPQALLVVNDRWYLRDANWFLNFPESARKMTEFYEKEGGQTPDLVMVMTPELVVTLLESTGPIAMPAYGTTLTSENFIETTQLITSVYYDRALNQPKQMLADFFPVLLQTISALPVPEKLRAFQSLQEAFAQKQILLYSKNSDTQKKIEQFNWGGAVAHSDRDYLAVTTTNLGGTKTDTYIEQQIDVQTNITATGEVTDTVTITRKNTLQQSANTLNKSYLRMYVPHGATLLSASGFSPVEIPLANEAYKKDPDIATIETSAIEHLASGTRVGVESDKTVFGNWIITEGGETQTVTITYHLPFTLNELDRYSLIMQKQPGAPLAHVTHTITYPDYTTLWQTGGNGTESTAHGTKRTYELKTDQLTGLVLERN